MSLNLVSYRYANRLCYYYFLFVALVLTVSVECLPGFDEKRLTESRFQMEKSSELAELPTLYEYFLDGSSSDIQGLVADRDGFKLNGKPIRIISGAIHYFRVHPSLWRDRLKKLRAVGANTVETYVPWNLHEPLKDEWDFGSDPEKYEMSLFLDVRKFLQIAQEEDLLVIFRPGPYICAEFEFGGFPSYLLRDPDMKVRTGYKPFLDRAKVFLDKLFPLVEDLQFTKGGPIIAVQVENEYGSFDTIDKSYMEFLLNNFNENGMNSSLLFTSDGTYNGEKGSLPELLKTANFNKDPQKNLDMLLSFQPDKPVMVTEYWAGWFDHWFEPHSQTSADGMYSDTLTILKDYNGSINFYMFHGGTNFGFTGGANSLNHAPYYASDVTSYDYDAPLSESGDYTVKYYKILELAEAFSVPHLKRPILPPLERKFAYPPVKMQEVLSFENLLEQVPASSKFQLEKVLSMENLPMNGESGQSQGYVLYRKRINLKGKDAEVGIFKAGPVRDFGLLLLNNEILSLQNHWINSVQEYNLTFLPERENVLDLLIQNMGRIGFGKAKDFLQHKGLHFKGRENSTYFHLNEEEIQDVEVVALEFKSAWVKGLENWKALGSNLENSGIKGPALFQSTFMIDSDSEPSDTFLDMSGWTKGIAFINGFNLGKYFNVGPQQALYVPAPLLKKGENKITIFEELKPQEGFKVAFSSVPKLGSEDRI